MKTIPKPEPHEYAPYTIMYIGLLPDDGLILKHLEDNRRATTDFMRAVPEEKLSYRYAEGKWTIKEIMAHLIDDERIYAYRALRFARNDQTELPGFDQDDYMLTSHYDQIELEDLLSELRLIRLGNIAMFRTLDEEAWSRVGVANSNSVSVRAIAFAMAGHVRHHMNVLRERYLSGEKS